MSHLASLTREKLNNWAGERSFERGADYFAQGLARDLVVYRDTLAAAVYGSDTYQVKISFNEKGAVDFECSCPHGVEGNFCKHCVAVGLAYLDSQANPQAGKTNAPTLEDVRVYLEQQPVTWLADMVMAQVMEDKRLRDKLLLTLTRTRGQRLDLNAYRRRVSNAIKVNGYLEYGEAEEYAEDVQAALESVQDLLAEGYATEVMELAELALVELNRNREQVFDEESEIYSLSEPWVNLHRQSCEQARPDPEALAHKLFKYEIEDNWEELYGALPQYAEALGEKGRAVYRRLAEDAWCKIPALRPGESHSYSDSRSRLTNIMERFAQESGDIETLVTVKSRNLSQPRHFLDIAIVYQAAKNYDKALEWAEEGMRVFTETEPGGLAGMSAFSSFHQSPTTQLGLFLAEEYQRRGRHDEAIAIVWQQLTDDISLGAYQKLAEHAQRAGAWDTWRPQALDNIRAFIEANKKPQPNSHWAYHKSDHSLLVEIFLWESNPDDALAEAQKGGCSEQLWLKLAAALEAQRPADAVDIYLQRVVPKIDQTNNQAYDEAVGFLKKARELLPRLGRENEFAPFIATLRADYKRKRNFMALLSKMGW